MTASATHMDSLAINGGPPAVPAIEGTPRPKVGIEEFMELVDTWGFSADVQKDLKAIAEREPDTNPSLARYYNPRPSKVTALEELAAELFGAPYALAVNSGASALNTAYVAAEIGPGCEVIVPAYTFFATTAEVVIAGAIPVIAEVDESLALDPADVERKITPRTRAIVPVHMRGEPTDMASIMAIARRHNLLVIEDNAQSCGGAYKGQMLGTIGDFGCFSLSSYKITGAGEAGLVLMHDMHSYVRALNNHDTAACWRPDRYAVEQEDEDLFCGYNFRMSELEGAVNLAQLRKMPEQTERYRRVKHRIAARLGDFQGITPQRINDPDGEVGYSLCYFAPNNEMAQTTATALKAEGIRATTRSNTPGSSVRDWHIYAYWQHITEKKSATPDGFPWTHPKNAAAPDYAPDMCPRTLDLLDRAVFVGVNQWWTEGDCDCIAHGINKVLEAYCGRPSGHVGR